VRVFARWQHPAICSDFTMAHVIQPSGEDVVLCTACYLLILYDVRHTVRGADVHRLTRPTFWCGGVYRRGRRMRFSARDFVLCVTWVHSWGTLATANMINASCMLRLSCFVGASSFLLQHWDVRLLVDLLWPTRWPFYYHCLPGGRVDVVAHCTV